MNNSVAFARFPGQEGQVANDTPKRVALAQFPGQEGQEERVATDTYEYWEGQRKTLGLHPNTPIHMVLSVLEERAGSEERTRSIRNAIRFTVTDNNATPEQSNDDTELPTHLARAVGKGTLSREEALSYM